MSTPSLSLSYVKIICMRVLLVLLLSSPAVAMTVLPDDIQQELDQAILVANVEVLETTSSQESSGLIETKSRVRVLDVIKVKDDGGWIPAESETFWLSTVGGEVGELGMLLDGYPRPHRGQQYRAYLVRKSSDEFEIAGLEFGLVPLNPSRNYSRNRTDGSNGDGNGAFLYWDRKFLPIPYYISIATFDTLPDAVLAIDQSFKTWRNVRDVIVEFQPMGCTSETHNQNDGINTVILMKDRWNFGSRAIAITRNFYIAGNSLRAGLILDSDILLNAVHHSFTTSNEPGKHDVQNIVTHEIGHLLGLGHETAPEDTNATMYVEAAKNETKKRELHANDLAGLRAGYGGIAIKPATLAYGASCTSEYSGSCLAVHGTGIGGGGLVALVLLLLPLAFRNVIARASARSNLR